MKKAALISVSDRTGILEFAQVLQELDYAILCTTGTGTYLKENGVNTLSIEEYTGQKEILGGRVKTLHPKIHAGLLAKLDDPTHVAQLAEDNIYTIEVAAVNLYPFEDKLKGEFADDPEKMVEFVDIGGPTMIRAAAKNFKTIYPVFDPKDYGEVGVALKEKSHDKFLGLRHKLAVKVFSELAHYNLEIAKYFSSLAVENNKLVAGKGGLFDKDIDGLILKKKQNLRYGENPHQSASFYTALKAEKPNWTQLQGKELSYNNLLDFDAALRMMPSLPSAQAGTVLVKHLNPCGAAYADTLTASLQNAKKCDPRSHFGGIIALNRKVEIDTAEEIAKDFCEIVLAPEYSEEALVRLSSKKNLRVIRVDIKNSQSTELRSIQSGVLLQEGDTQISDVQEAKLTTKRKPSEGEYNDLQFAWNFCAHVKSNAITIVRDGMLLSNGGGQTSRIDALEVALLKVKTHGHSIKGAVAASDAFFPFYDCIEELASNGVVGVVVPSGAKRDEEVVAKAEELGVSLLFVEDRHFRH